MLFQSLVFLLFFVPVFVGNLVCTNVLRNALARKWLFVLASAVFYMSWNVPLYALLVTSIAVNFLAARRVAAGGPAARRWLAMAIVAQLSILGLFKYANFGIEAASELLAIFGMAPPKIVLEILLPLGISFYTFQGMSYTIDVYRGHFPPYSSFLDFFLYISFFPQLVAGPIVRADFFRDQLDRIGATITLPQVSSGLFLFVFGVFKKVVLADNAAAIANTVFYDPASHSSLIVVLGVYSFAFQIYFDFSGYTDMARGLGRMLGIELPINFRMPYLARGLREFWQRWHISLSTWLRDYLYISLGGSRVSTWVTYRNLLITMVLGGLWHGASWNFLIWGAVHGALLASEHATFGKGERTLRAGWQNALAIFLTFQVVCFAWIFFRAEDLPQAWTMLTQLTDLPGYLRFDELALFKPQNWAFGLVFPALFAFALERGLQTNEIGLEIRSPLLRAVGFTSIFFLILLTAGKTNEFIYFQF